MWIFGGDPIGHAAWLLSMFGNSDLSLGPPFLWILSFDPSDMIVGVLRIHSTRWSCGTRSA